MNSYHLVCLRKCGEQCLAQKSDDNYLMLAHTFKEHPIIMSQGKLHYVMGEYEIDFPYCYCNAIFPVSLQNFKIKKLEITKETCPRYFESKDKCICSSYDLFNFGCRCGHVKKEDS